MLINISSQYFAYESHQHEMQCPCAQLLDRVESIAHMLGGRSALTLDVLCDHEPIL